jgi:hypothetical protein
MAIEDYMNTPFVLKRRTEQKVDGRTTTSYSQIDSGLCAIFTASEQRTVRFGGQDFVIQKNLYCFASKDIQEGDIVEVDGGEYDVVFKNNTNNLDHHLQIGLVSR